MVWVDQRFYAFLRIKFGRKDVKKHPNRGENELKNDVGGENVK